MPSRRVALRAEQPPPPASRPPTTSAQTCSLLRQVGAGVGAAVGSDTDDHPFGRGGVGCDLAVEGHVGEDTDDVMDGARDSGAARLAVREPVNRAAVNDPLHGCRSVNRELRAGPLRDDERGGGSGQRERCTSASCRRPGTSDRLWVRLDGQERVSAQEGCRRCAVAVTELDALDAIRDNAERDPEPGCWEHDRAVAGLVCGTDAVVGDNDECRLLAAAKRRKRWTGEHVGCDAARDGEAEAE